MAVPFPPGQFDQRFPQFPGYGFDLAARVARLERQYAVLEPAVDRLARQVNILERTVDQLNREVTRLGREVDQLDRRLTRCCPRF